MLYPGQCGAAEVLASCPLPAQMPRGLTPHPENYSADCSTGRTMIPRESLLVKSYFKKANIFFIPSS